MLPAACTPVVHQAVIPTWARAGFSGKRPAMPLALGEHGRIVALVWGDPLFSPPSKVRSNKILWVARKQVEGATNLRISAQRMSGTHTTGAPVTRTVAGGPGPSIIDLPRPGCWRLTLRWSKTSDRLDLRYQDNSAT